MKGVPTKVTVWLRIPQSSKRVAVGLWMYLSFSANFRPIMSLRRLLDANFPVRLLPPVVPDGHVVGSVKDGWGVLPPGAEVTAAIGDLQASTLAATWRQGNAGECLVSFKKCL